MPNFPLVTDSNDRYRTFIIVVASLLATVGAIDLLHGVGSILISFWTYRAGMGFEFAVPRVSQVIFATGSLFVGLRLLNLHPKALSQAVAFLWAYVVWTIGALAWAIGTFVVVDFGSPLPDSEIARESFVKGIAYLVFGFVTGLAMCLVCGWIARRLSLPVIKASYQP